MIVIKKKPNQSTSIHMVWYGPSTSLSQLDSCV